MPALQFCNCLVSIKHDGPSLDCCFTVAVVIGRCPPADILGSCPTDIEKESQSASLLIK